MKFPNFVTALEPAVNLPRRTIFAFCTDFTGESQIVTKFRSFFGVSYSATMYAKSSFMFQWNLHSFVGLDAVVCNAS